MEMMNLTAQSMLMSKMFYPLEVTLGEKKVMDELQKTQNAVMSVVTNSNIMSNTGEMLANLSSNAFYEINSPPHGHAAGVFVMLLRPPAVVAKHANTHTICRSVM